MTPARIASLAVVLVLTLVLTPLRADDGSFVGALLVALIGAVLLVAGAWCAPLARTGDALGGTLLRPWRPEYEGPKTTQVAGGGLVALLVGLITGGAPFVGPLLGLVAAVAAGRFLHIPSPAEAAAVVGTPADSAPAEEDDDQDDDRDTDELPSASEGDEVEPMPAVEPEMKHRADDDEPADVVAEPVGTETAPVPIVPAPEAGEQVSRRPR